MLLDDITFLIAIQQYFLSIISRLTCVTTAALLCKHVIINKCTMQVLAINWCLHEIPFELLRIFYLFHARVKALFKILL